MAEVERRQCTARSKRTGERCQRPPRLGAAVCHQHGGASPQAQRAAARRLAEAKAAKSLAEHGVTPIDDPAAELLAVAEEARALSRFLASYAAQAQDGSADAGELRARLDALGRSQERAARILVDVQRLGLADARLALDAQRVAIVEALLVRVVIALGRDPRDPDVRAVLAREVRALPSAVVDGEVVE